MAIDTRNKRASIFGLGLVAALALPAPGSSLTDVDPRVRAHVAYSYAGSALFDSVANEPWPDDAGLYLLEAELDGPGNGWTDLTPDLSLDQNALVAQYGIQGNTPADRIGSAGSLTFDLDNSDPMGRYSLFHANRRHGWDLDIGVRLRLRLEDTTYYKFRGRLADVVPVPFLVGQRVARCTALDWMDDAARMTEPDLEAQVDQRADEILTTLLDALPVPPIARILDAGSERYQVSFDGGTGQQPTVRERIAQLCASEFGYAFVCGDTSQGGTFKFQNRRARALTAVKATLDDTTLDQLSVPNSRDDVYRRIQITVHPINIDDSPTTVLFQLQSTRAYVKPGEALDTLFGPYRDPQTNDFVGGTDIQPLIAGTDYLMNSGEDGSGSNLTANFTVDVSATGSGVRFTITNTGAVGGFVTKLQLVGRAIRRIDATIERTLDSTPYGDRTLALDMPFQADVNVASEIADYLSIVFGAPLPRATAARFLATFSDDLLAAALQVEPGDRVHVQESVTGLDSDSSVNSVRLELAKGQAIWCTWGLEPALATASRWRLGVAGASELGETTVVGL